MNEPLCVYDHSKPGKRLDYKKGVCGKPESMHCPWFYGDASDDHIFSCRKGMVHHTFHRPKEAKR